MLRPLLVLALLLPQFIVPRAANAPSPSCQTTVAASQAAISGAISAAAAGDTICVSDGSFTTATSNFTIAKFIKLKAVNVGGVTITNNVAADLFTVTEQTAGSVVIAGFALQWQLITSGKHLFQINPGSVGAKPVLVHDVTMSSGDNGVGFARVETNRGVFWNITIDLSGSLSGGQANDAEGFQFKIPGGSSTWVNVSKWGADDTAGDQNVYVEDSTFTWIRLQAFDCDDNARISLRHNTFTNSGGTSHGADTSTDGCRTADLSHNTFQYIDADQQNVDYYLLPRGGTWSIHDNDFQELAGSFIGNNKSEIKLEIQNLQRNAGPYACWSGGYPAPHQVGTGGNGASQVSEPVYLWNNTGAGADAPGFTDYSGGDACASPPSIEPSGGAYIQLNRDYFYPSTARPGYSDFTYPHPLRTQG